MKIVKNGWVGRSWEERDIVLDPKVGLVSKELNLLIPLTHGRKNVWFDEDWPPRRATVTIDIEE